MYTDALLRYVIYTGLFAVLFIPFIVASPLFFPFITGKAFAFRIVVEIIFALWIIRALRDPLIRPQRSLILYTLLALIISLGVSAALGENPSKSLWSNFERMEGLISFLHLGAFFVVLASVFRSEELWRRFWNISIAVSVALALYGVFQLVGIFTINQGGVRVDATFGNATYLAIYMLFHFFLTLLALFSWRPSVSLRVWYSFALALQTLMIFYAATRGTILGLLGGLLLSSFIFIIFGKRNAGLRKVGIAVLAVLVFLIGGFFAVKNTPLVQESGVLTRLAQISLEAGETRFTIWKMAWKGFLDRPVFGWGQEGFNYVFNRYYEPSLYAQEPWFDRAHNQFIDMALAGGVVGFVLYLSLFMCALYYLWRRDSVFDVTGRALLTGFLAAYAFHNLFVFDNLMSYILFLSVLAYLARETNTVPSTAKTAPIPPATIQAVSVFTLAALAGVLYVANVPGIVRAYNLIEALKPHCVTVRGEKIACLDASGSRVSGATTDLGQNFSYFKQAVAGGGIGRQEAHEQLIQFALQIMNENLAPLSSDAFKSEVASFAKEAFSKEVRRAPNDARLRLFYGTYLRQSGDFTGAEQELTRAHELSPKKQTILSELGLLAINQGNAAGAVTRFKEAYELDPAFDDARVNYAATLLRVGQAEEAKRLLIEGFGTPTPDNGVILQAYLDTNDYASVIAIAEARVRDNPDDPQKRVELAAAYLNAGRRADAIASLREAIRLNPGLKAQGEQYIQQIERGETPH